MNQRVDHPCVAELFGCERFFPQQPDVAQSDVSGSFLALGENRDRLLHLGDTISLPRYVLILCYILRLHYLCGPSVVRITIHSTWARPPQRTFPSRRGSANAPTARWGRAVRPGAPFPFPPPKPAPGMRCRARAYGRSPRGTRRRNLRRHPRAVARQRRRHRPTTVIGDHPGSPRTTRAAHARRGPLRGVVTSVFQVGNRSSVHAGQVAFVGVDHVLSCFEGE